MVLPQDLDGNKTVWFQVTKEMVQGKVGNRTALLSVVMSGPWIMYTWVKVVHGYVLVMDHVTKENVCK